MKSEKKERLPQITLERLALDELSPFQRAKAINNLMNEDGGEERLKELKRSNDSILKDYPPEIIAAKINEKIISKPKEYIETKTFSMRPIVSILSSVAVLIIGITISLRFLPVRSGDIISYQTSSDIRMKGESRIFIYKKDGAEALSLKDGDFVREGDILQLSYITDKPYVLIFSIDGRQTVTLHSTSEDASIGEKTTLESAYQLDNAPKYEKFFLIASDSPISVSEALNKAESLAELGAKDEEAKKLFEGAKVKSLMLRK